MSTSSHRISHAKDHHGETLCLISEQVNGEHFVNGSRRSHLRGGSGARESRKETLTQFRWEKARDKVEEYPMGIKSK